MTENKDIHKDCAWRVADDGPTENPLQALVLSICKSPKDFGEQKFDAYLYGVIVGWGDESYEELKVRHNWSEETVKYQKLLHQNYIKAWNLLTENNVK